MRSIPVSEGVPFELEPDLRAPLQAEVARLRGPLRTGLATYTEADGRCTVSGLVGTIAIRPGVRLEIAPKVDPDGDWIAAVLDLLELGDRFDAAGDRRSGFAAHRDMLDVLAALYAERLRRALRREGPLLVMERRTDESAFLKGRLDTTAWSRTALWQPHRFSVAYQSLTADNAYSRTLAVVARRLAATAADPAVRGSLLDSARALRPGAPQVVHADAGVELRPLPPQWSIYAPAWDIAVAVLGRRALLGSTGTRHGVSLVVEAWPLLERLLERSLDAAVAAAGAAGRALSRPAKRKIPMLEPDPGNPWARTRTVEPDGVLEDEGTVIATFEAKYQRTGPPSQRTGEKSPSWPTREHLFQALTTAAVCDSPLSVLVYPERLEPAWWTVKGLNGHPVRLAAIGLDLFGYRSGSGERERGELLLALLEQCSPSG